MAKRFTDTDKWKKEWYLNLGPKLRDIRQFILDDCDHAGIWEINMKRIQALLGYEITSDEIKKAFNGKIQVIGKKLFIATFIDFQYQGKLNKDNRSHSSVIKILENLKIDLSPYISPLLGASVGATLGCKDKDKDTVKDKDKDKEPSAPCVTNNVDNSNSMSPSSHLKSELDYYKYAIKHFGHSNTVEAKSWLGDVRWSNVKTMGGWSELCKMKWDDFTDQRIKKVIEVRN